MATSWIYNKNCALFFRNRTEKTYSKLHEIDQVPKTNPKKKTNPINFDLNALDLKHIDEKSILPAGLNSKFSFMYIKYHVLTVSDVILLPPQKAFSECYIKTLLK